jgi:lipopolysaccharide transport system permease protein
LPNLTDGIPQLAFYLAAQTIWKICKKMARKRPSSVITSNASIFGKVYFPRLIMPLSIVASSLLKFAVQFALFIAVVLYYTFVEGSIHPNWWIFLPLFLSSLWAIFALGIGMIFSSLTTKYKDLSFLITFGIQLFGVYFSGSISQFGFACKIRFLRQNKPFV